MELDSKHWDKELFVCVKHCTPSLPCPQCLAEHDEAVTVRLSPLEESVLDCDPRATIRDLLPEDGDWLLDKITT
jgi:hypothetical protein